MNEEDFIKMIKFDDKGLVPAIAQDYLNNDVLMLAYMNEEALRKTLLTGKVHYYSRSRKAIWLKGESSGNFQYVKSIFYDCDADAILVKIEQKGVACHTGHRSCFYSEFVNGQIVDIELQPKVAPRDSSILDALYNVILKRKYNPPEKSYVHSLIEKGIDAIDAKILEEANEVVEAGKDKNAFDVIYESADLIFHLLVLLGYRDIAITDVYKELARRFGISGIDEKASREKKD